MVRMAPLIAEDIDQLYALAERFDAAADFTGRRVHVVWERASGSGIPEDVAVTSMDFLNVTAGNPDSTWVEADFGTLETLLDAWWGAINDFVSAQHTLREYRWYRVGPGVGVPNPAVRVMPRGTAGGAGGTPLPPQVAMTITERVAPRKHWGRMYVPSPTTAAVAGDGRIATTTYNGLLNATANLYDGAQDADFIPVVYSETKRRFLAVEKLQVDDLFDVVRSRRFDRPNNRAIFPV
jgi:hypothetical protein